MLVYFKVFGPKDCSLQNTANVNSEGSLSVGACRNYLKYENSSDIRKFLGDLFAYFKKKQYLCARKVFFDYERTFFEFT
jgi:hypothetical protein